MRFYTHTHKNYCGIDLHARSIRPTGLEHLQDRRTILRHERQCGHVHYKPAGLMGLSGSLSRSFYIEIG